jgi:hypothetical protein
MTQKQRAEEGQSRSLHSAFGLRTTKSGDGNANQKIATPRSDARKSTDASRVPRSSSARGHRYKHWITLIYRFARKGSPVLGEQIFSLITGKACQYSPGSRVSCEFLLDGNRSHIHMMMATKRSASQSCIHPRPCHSLPTPPTPRSHIITTYHTHHYHTIKTHTEKN